MSFFQVNKKVFFLIAFSINFYFILYIFMAIEHNFLERDIQKLKKSYAQLAQENEKVKVNLKIISEERVLNKKKTNYRKKNIKEIPVVRFF